jgi:hypothetical protein
MSISLRQQKGGEKGKKKGGRDVARLKCQFPCASKKERKHGMIFFSF